MSLFASTADDKTDGSDMKDATVPVDAIIHAAVSDNGLEAYINIEPPQYGGAAPTLEKLKTALAGIRVSYNIDTEKLEELEKAPVYNRNIVVARGLEPVNGVDGTVSFYIETEKKSLKPKLNEDGTVDFRDLSLVENVTQGQVLCTITLPTEGSPGVSVIGKKLPQTKGRPVPSYAGNNTEFSPDGTALLAKITGQIEFFGNKIHVNETYYVKENVDHSTGNIKVTGNLVVMGMVQSGFQIEAGKNIEVKGTVENATIKAGGNIKLQSGITGSTLYCGGDLKCRFIQNCNIFVKGDINSEYILKSNIKCGKSLKTTGITAPIIGGRCLVGRDIIASTIGSDANVRTRLELGTDYTVIERQQELQAQIAEEEKKIKSIKPLINMLRQLEANDQLTQDKRQILEKVGYSYDASMKILEDSKKELEEINQSIKVKGYGRIICSGTIYPGTEVVIGPAALFITEKLTRTYLYYNDGDICKGSAR